MLAPKRRKGRRRPTTTEIAAVRTTYNKIRPARTMKERVAKGKRGRGRPLSLFPDPRDSSSYKGLLKHFIAPLVRSLELGDEPDEKLPLNDRLGLIFGIRFREINLAVAEREFTMPGKVWRAESPADLVYPTVRQSRVPKGCPMMVRIDERMPERIDIELCDTEKGLMFSLTASEYRSIVPYLTEITGANHKLAPPGGS